MENNEEALFYAAHPYDKQWVKYCMAHPVLKPVKVCRLLLVVLAAVSGAMGIANLVIFGLLANLRMVILSIVVVGISIFAIYADYLNIRLAMKNVSNLYGSNQWQAEYAFYQDKMLISTGNQRAEYLYSKIGRVEQDAFFVYIWINSTTVCRVPKNAFVKGDYNQLIGLMQQQLGPLAKGSNTVLYVRSVILAACLAVLIVTMGGTALSYILWAIAH